MKSIAVKYKFNLLTDLTKKNTSNVKRSESIFYSFTLVLAGIIIYLLLFLVETLIVKSKINQNNKKITLIEKETSNLDESQIAFGKLISQSKLLEPILEKDIQLQTFLSLIGLVIPNNSDVLSYKREIGTKETNGEDAFVVEFVVNNYQIALVTLEKLLTEDKIVKDAYIETMSKYSNQIKVNLRMLLINES